MAKKAAPSKGTSVKPASARALSKKPMSDVLVAVAPTHEQIAERAFAHYLARGCADGGAMGDWLRAEHELSARA